MTRPLLSSIAKFLLFLSGLLLLAAAGSLALQKRIVAQDVPGGGKARLTLPNYWSQILGSRVLLEREGGGEAKLYYGLFEQPLMLLPGREPATVMCIYSYDTVDEVIVFDLGARLGRYAPIRGEEVLQGMVWGSEFLFRKANLEELRYALSVIHGMTESSYKLSSVPTVDLGWFRYYAPRRNIAALVERVRQDTISPPEVFTWPPGPTHPN